MLTCRLLKQNALRSLKKRRARAAWICFADAFLRICAAALLGLSVSGIIQPLLDSASRTDLMSWVWGGLTVFTFGGPWLIFHARILNGAQLGAARYFMESRGGLCDKNTIAAFGNGNESVCKTHLLYKQICVTLWGLLLIVPGVIRHYEYRLAEYLWAENPAMSYRRALSLSKQMTKGEKAAMLRLDLSFIGWFLLCLATAGVALYWVGPYYRAAWAEFYAAMRAKALAQKLASKTELGGFYKAEM